MGRLRSHSGTWLWIGIVVAATLFVIRSVEVERTRWHGVLADDAYISLRHARHFAEGHGFNYNRGGERVEGYTNFLYTAAMSAPFFLGLDPERWVKGMGVASGVGLIVAATLLGRTLVGPAAGLALGLGLAVDARTPGMAVWGMETLLFAALGSAAFVLLFRGRWLLASTVLALAAMTRMEAVLLFAVACAYVFVEAWYRERGATARRSASRGLAAATRFAVPFGALFGSYDLMRWGYYGYPFPNTFYAKVGSPLAAYARGLEYLELCFSHMQLRLVVVAGLVALAVLPLAWLGVRARDRRRAGRSPDRHALRGGAVVAASALYLLYVIAVGGDDHTTFGERFLYHVWPLLLLGLALVLAATLAAGREALRAWRGRDAPRDAADAGSWSATLLTVGIVAAVASSSCPVFAGSHELVVGWASLGTHLRRVADPDDLLAVSAAGAIPYYSRLRTIDMHGLADVHIGHRPQELGTGPAGHEKWDLRYVLSRKPRWIGVWIAPDGGGLRPPGYRLAALVRMDGTEIDPARVMRVDRNLTRAELAALRRGDGFVPGNYSYGLLERVAR